MRVTEILACRTRPSTRQDDWRHGKQWNRRIGQDQPVSSENRTHLEKPSLSDHRPLLLLMRLVTVLSLIPPSNGVDCCVLLRFLLTERVRLLGRTTGDVESNGIGGSFKTSQSLRRIGSIWRRFSDHRCSCLLSFFQFSPSIVRSCFHSSRILLDGPCT